MHDRLCIRKCYLIKENCNDNFDDFITKIKSWNVISLENLFDHMLLSYYTIAKKEIISWNNEIEKYCGSNLSDKQCVLFSTAMSFYDMKTKLSEKNLEIDDIKNAINDAFFLKMSGEPSHGIKTISRIQLANLNELSIMTTELCDNIKHSEEYLNMCVE